MRSEISTRKYARKTRETNKWKILLVCNSLERKSACNCLKKRNERIEQISWFILRDVTFVWHNYWIYNSSFICNKQKESTFSEVNNCEIDPTLCKWILIWHKWLVRDIEYKIDFIFQQVTFEGKLSRQTIDLQTMHSHRSSMLQSIFSSWNEITNVFGTRMKSTKTLIFSSKVKVLTVT